MDLCYRKLLFETMHMATCRKGDGAKISDKTLMKAVTVNENLHSVGLTLRPADIWMLASSASLDTFDKEVFELIPQIKAEPMYPGFPHQVMKMTEAQFRFHQMLHYFSTYGMELLTGKEVSRGWLPQAEGPQRTKEDKRLLEDTVLELVYEDEAGKVCLQRLFSRRERLTEPQLELVRLSLAKVEAEDLADIRILFKENLELVFPIVFEKMDGEDAVRILHSLCAHTGDVLNNIHLVLKKHRYHLRTSQKRMLVHLLESYSPADLRGNLILSNAKRERNLTVLKHLDYNAYSRSAAHKAAVDGLRGKQLHSWESQAEKKIRNHEVDALAFLSKRPGIMVRKLNLLLCLGYEEQTICEYLCESAQKLSSQTLVRLLTVVRTTGREEILSQNKQELEQLEYKYNELLYRLDTLEDACDLLVWREKEKYYEDICAEEEKLEKALAELTEEKIKKACSRELASRREELTAPLEPLISGQKTRVKALENSLRKIEERISFLKAAAISRETGSQAMAFRKACAAGLIHRLTGEEKRIRERLSAEKSGMESFVQEYLQQSGWEKESAQIRETCAQRLKEMPLIVEKLRREHEAVLAELEEKHVLRIRKIREEFSKKQEKAPETRRKLCAEKQREQECIRKKYDLRLRSLSNYPAMKRILTQALHEHFKGVSTVLRGKRIYVDEGGFDLKHSLMKAMDKSADSTYVNSGFAWRIPEEASSVRFFVYWNDSRRVDIDLHASAAAASDPDHPDRLSQFHVGWNSDFRKNGVVHSGDITHSNAAEYIDVCMDSPVRYVTMNIDLYYGKNSFREIEECFAGLMAVGDGGETVRLYDPANCFFTHDLQQRTRFLHYGYIDVKERYVRFMGSPDERVFASGMPKDPPESFYVGEYLELLLDSQGAVRVDTPEEADLILSIGKSKETGAVSLIDSNFFLDA